MARPLRIEVEGGWFHITSRGQNKDRIFLDLPDAMNFAGRLSELPERFGVEVHGYVMMPNHYHLLLRTPHGNLSRAVQWLNTGYSIWWNNRHERVGHVFQGRFKSILVEEGSRILNLSLYMHFNPVAVESLGLGKKTRAAAALGLGENDPALLEKRLQTLRSWRWSSYRAFAGYDESPTWLSTDVIWDRIGGTAESYRQWAESRLSALGGAVWSDLHRGIILGSPEFSAKTSARLVPTRETPLHSSWTGRLTWEHLLAWVEKKRGKPWAELCLLRGDWGRDVAWWAGKRWTGLTLKELGEISGGIDYATVAKAIERWPGRCDKDEQLKSLCNELTDYCKASSAAG
jgi:REP element-mobilizing transposase RayT